MLPCSRLVRFVFLACAAVMVSGLVQAQQPPAAQAKPPAATPAAPGKAPPDAPKDPVVATVNGQPIYLSELQVAQQALPPQYRNMPLSSVYPALLDRIIDSKLVVADGKKNKVDVDPAFKKRMAFVEDQVIQDFWLQKELEQACHPRQAAGALPGEAEVDAGRGRGACAPHPGRHRAGGEGPARRAQEGRAVRQARQGEVDRQGVGRRRRRSRLVQAHRHGEGILRRRLRAQEGRDSARRRSRRSSAITSSRSRIAARRRRRPSRSWPISFARKCSARP